MAPLRLILTGRFPKIELIRAVSDGTILAPMRKGIGEAP